MIKTSNIQVQNENFLVSKKFFSFFKCFYLIINIETLGVGYCSFNPIFNSISITYISRWSVLLVEETGVVGKDKDLVQVTDKLSHNVVLSTPCH